MKLISMLLLLALAAGAPGCALLGPTCVAGQERGNVTSLQGQVGAGEMASHVVRYDTRGSQNNADLTWSDMLSANPSRVTFYATRAGCTSFRPTEANSADCAVLASAGWTPLGTARTLIVTHGRGNPEQLGAAPEYRIWVVGDAERAVSYTIAITYFYGPDC